ncbi:MAG: hypothetical protein HOK28_16590 [Deltaproteobacteria bacterium]|jgi:uncharacterized protein|nr:hypothetical protein [Deltaproteobacteria bacterium]
MNALLLASWDVMLELSVWLLLGAIIASLLHAFIPSSMIRKQFQGVSGVFKAVLLGVPLPLCSCGVIPAGLGLKKDGASSGSTVGFLISTPQTGVDSILVCASFLGWPFALFKVFAAFLTGIVGGVICNLFPDESPAVEEPVGSTSSARPGLRESTEHGIDIIRSIWGWLAVGVLIAAMINVWMPPAWLEGLAAAGTLTTLLLVLGLSIPMYVCATASVPIAAALVAGGLPPGAALVFLMAGPATNVATVGAVFRGIGKTAGVVYLSTLILGSLILALLFDELLTLQMVMPSHAHEHTAWWQIAPTIILILMFAKFAIEDLQMMFGRMKTQTFDLRVEVGGMTCNGCVGRLQKTLIAHEEIESAQVQLEPGQAKVSGSISEKKLLELIETTGFKPGARL